MIFVYLVLLNLVVFVITECVVNRAIIKEFFKTLAWEQGELIWSLITFVSVIIGILVFIAVMSDKS